MAKEPIELLKTYDPAKLKFPCVMQQKFDGVPLRFIRAKDQIANVSRQSKPVHSVEHLYADLQRIIDPGGFVIGEMYSYDLPFKTLSGLVRKNAPAPSLVCMVFDADVHATGGAWITRYRHFAERLRSLVYDKYSSSYHDCKVKPIFSKRCNSIEQAEAAYTEFMQQHPDAEGVVFRSIDAEFQPGTRRWHVQKRKPKPTIDLEVVGYEEAKSAEGQPLAMVGRVNVAYKGEVIGCGPGKLTHAERRELWESMQLGIAEIEYMQDDTYDALRQPTFQRWRPDKEKPDA